MSSTQETSDTPPPSSPTSTEGSDLVSSRSSSLTSDSAIYLEYSTAISTSTSSSSSDTLSPTDDSIRPDLSTPSPSLNDPSSTSSPTQCTATCTSAAILKTQSPPDAICGSRGSSQFDRYSYTEVTSAQQCADICIKDCKCASFEYKNSISCGLFHVSATDTGFFAGSVDVFMYDQTCFDCASGATLSASTTIQTTTSVHAEPLSTTSEAPPSTASQTTDMIMITTGPSAGLSSPTSEEGLFYTEVPFSSGGPTTSFGLTPTSDSISSPVGRSTDSQLSSLFSSMYSSSTKSSPITTTIFSGTATGRYITTVTATDGQEIIEVVQPSPTQPGMAYRAFACQQSATPDTDPIPRKRSPTILSKRQQACRNDPDIDFYNNNPDSIFSGIAQNINFDTESNDQTFPGQANAADVRYLGVVYQGYFQAPADATYRLGSSASTRYTGYIWTGEKAFSQWTSDNSDAHSATDSGPGNVEFTLAAGELLPVTILWYNLDDSRGGGALNIFIERSDVDGTVYDTTGWFLLPRNPDRFSYPLPVQYITGVTTVGSMLTTETYGYPEPTETLSIDKPIPTGTITTTIISGTADATVTITGPYGETTVQVSRPPGLLYNAYINPKNKFTDPSNYKNDYPANAKYFNSPSNYLITCGTALDIRFQAGEDEDFGALPGQSNEISLVVIAVIFHGWFLPPQTGDYRFYPTGRPFSFAWIGQEALNAWDETNLKSSRDFQASNGNSFSCTEQVAVPVTFVYINYGGAAQFGFSMTLPDQSTISDFTGYFYQPQSVDNWSPPPNPACPSMFACDSLNFYQFYFGSGHTVDVYYTGPTQSTNYRGDLTQPQARSTCGGFASYYGYAGFMLYFLESQNIWQCTIFNSYLTSPFVFFVVNGDVREGYAFSMCNRGN